MFKEGLRAAVLAACVFGATASLTHAGAPGVQGSLVDILIGEGLVPVTNGPGPRPPPKLDASASESALLPGPRPPPTTDGGPKGVTPPPK